MEKRGNLLHVILALILAGCGSSSLNVSNTHLPPDGRRPARKVVETIENSPREAHERILQELHEKRGDNLDFTDFWRELTKSPVATPLLQAHSEILLSLEWRSCTSDGVQSFLEFLYQFKTGGKYLLERRKCQLPLPPFSVNKILKLALDNPDFLPRNLENYRSLGNFLIKEYQTNAGAWNSTYLIELEGPLETYARHISTWPETSPLLIDLAETFASPLGHTPFQPIVRQLLYFDDVALSRLIDNRGLIEATRITSTIPLSQEFLEEFSVDNFKLLRDKLFHNSFSGTLWHVGWSHYLYLRQLSHNLSRFWALRDRLELLNNLQLQFGDWLRTLPRENWTLYVESMLKTLSPDPRNLDLLWFAKDNLDPGFLPSQILLASLDHINSTIADPMDRVLLNRLYVHFTAEMRDKKSQIEKYCSYLSQQGLPTQILDIDTLRESLQNQHLSVGCYRVESDDEIVINNAEAPLTAPFDSVIQIPDVNVSLKSSFIQLGMIDLSSQKLHADLSTQVTPESFDAVVIPTVVAIVLPNSGKRLFKGTHFMTVHTVIREAKDGPTTAVTPMQGFPGGNLTIISKERVRSIEYVSAGNRGQKGEPNRSGGKKDTSEIEIDSLENWVSQLQANQGGFLKQHTPFFFHNHLIPVEIEDILDRGLRDNKNRLQAFGLKEYLDVLPLAQKNKISNVCRILMKTESVGADEIQICLAEFLAPLALTQFYDAYQKQKDTLRERDVLPLIDTLVPFTVKGGKPGPSNPEGEWGKSGVYQTQLIE